jgi:hypothetical protein
MPQVELALVGADVIFEVTVGVGGQLGLAHQGHGHVVDDAQVLEVLKRFIG